MTPGTPVTAKNILRDVYAKSCDVYKAAESNNDRAYQVAALNQMLSAAAQLGGIELNEVQLPAGTRYPE